MFNKLLPKLYWIKDKKMISLYRKLAYIFLMCTLYVVTIYIILGTHLVFASTVDEKSKIKQNLPDLKIVSSVVKKGDTVTSLLRPYLSYKNIYKISKHDDKYFSLAHIKTGRPYKLCLKENSLIRFEYEIDKRERLIVQKTPDGYAVSQAPIEYDTSLETVCVNVTSSLFASVKKAGEKNELAFKLSEIFAWDIDFIKDLQRGDSFKVLVEKKYRNGKHEGYGKIQAAFFKNKERVYKAFLYTTSKGVSGYYDETGRSLQKSFLKAPLAFSRISSGFSERRLHPVFKKHRPHPGIDYAAPAGTPIKAVGDGVIIVKEYHEGRGNYIWIRHNNGYVTCYNHMSRFAKRIKLNTKVAQGQVIGYVGMTGYATGPHLDFRMMRNGELVNPFEYNSQPLNPVGSEEKKRFITETKKLADKLLTAKGDFSAGDNLI